VSRRDLLTCDDASCLTRCHRAFVSNSCHFFRTPLSIPWRQIQSLRDADQAVGRFRHVTGIPDVAHAIVQRRWEMKNPAAQCIWHRRSTPFSSDESVASFLLVVGGCARAGKNCGLSGDRVVGAGAAAPWHDGGSTGRADCLGQLVVLVQIAGGIREWCNILSAWVLSSGKAIHASSWMTNSELISIACGAGTSPPRTSPSSATRLIARPRSNDPAQ